MRQSGVAGRGRNRVERGVTQIAVFAAKALEFGRGRQLINLAGGSGDLKPVQEPAYSRSVAGLRITVALDFGRVLDRLGQDRGVLLEGEARPAIAQGLGYTDHAKLRVDADLLAR